FKFVKPWLDNYKKDLRRFSILAFVFCLFMAFMSETVFGVSDITGAFVAGLLLSGNRRSSYIIGKFETISFMLLSPVFFASVGLKVSVDGMNTTIIIFMIFLLLVAVLTKIIGCGLGAKICGYTNLQATKIGVGMVSRGEVALIVATKGMALGLMLPEFFAPIVIIVVVTTIITPIMLKMVYKYQEKMLQAEDVMDSSLVERHQEKDAIEFITQGAIEKHEEMKKELEDNKKASKKANNEDS
ncbi:MAG: cation:proton antiporter, partial [Oscillospiraceae bacterium]